MPLNEITTVKDGDAVVEQTERKLYTLAELKALDERPASEQDDEIEGGAFENALNWLRDGLYDYDWWDTAAEDIHVTLVACGIEYKANDIEFDLDRGSKFVLPRQSSIDTTKFLRALKIYLSGIDVRIPLLGYGDTEGNASTAIRATGHQIRNLDLRSKDARIVREQGLVVYRVNGLYSKSDEFDLDYFYEGLSDQFKEDANEFLSDLCAYGLRVLRDEAEYLASEENLLEMGEINEYRFDRTGRRA
jgi:hypothetical protein